MSTQEQFEQTNVETTDESPTEPETPPEVSYFIPINAWMFTDCFLITNIINLFLNNTLRRKAY